MRKVFALGLACAALAAASPAGWVPARWKWSDSKTLDLLKGTPINCLLLDWDAGKRAALQTFAAEASKRTVVTLAVIRPSADPLETARDAVRAGMNGVVLDGDFASGAADRVREGLKSPEAAVIELTTRGHMRLTGADPVIGTYQGVWAGIQIEPDGHAKAGPTGSAWIDTNTGF